MDLYLVTRFDSPVHHNRQRSPVWRRSIAPAGNTSPGISENSKISKSSSLWDTSNFIYCITILFNKMDLQSSWFWLWILSGLLRSDSMQNQKRICKLIADFRIKKMNLRVSWIPDERQGLFFGCPQFSGKDLLQLPS